MSANDKQVDGNHYRGAYQHWDFAAEYSLDYFQGCITKYLARWRKKNGVRDLHKALHFAEKYLELAISAPPGQPVVNRAPGMRVTTMEWLQVTYQLDEVQQRVVTLAVDWRTPHDLDRLRATLSNYIQDVARAEQAKQVQRVEDSR